MKNHPLYLVFGALLLVFYLYSETRGLIYTSTDEKSAIPAGAAGSARGYRTHGFWFVGHHGGK
jgi:hypothetical protein